MRKFRHPVGTREHMPFPGHRTCAEWGPTPIDKFMDAVAEHGDVCRAAKLVGKSAKWGEQVLATYAGEAA